MQEQLPRHEEREALPRSRALRGNAVKARCAASHVQHLRMRNAARPALHSHVARGNEG